MTQMTFAEFEEQCRRIQSTRPNLANRRLSFHEEDFGRLWIITDSELREPFAVASAASTPEEAMHGFALTLT